ncbi:transcriptional Coactivator p15-domain-containing protein [Aspergillus coremiiformis]|uniref:Transcriptional Coactivator p15-domain-containing protein n=1 Tax=Aspergillus coremiiformis TaxID=138285 RepID=A0A5N6YU91_9EURO|nr:transcriptional Coactivator p15-domain-containing protein [Aspergillus coremiiformis]
MVSDSRKRVSGARESPALNDGHPQLKRTKTIPSRSAPTFDSPKGCTSATEKVDANGDKYWEISRMRRVTISSFRGKTLVNIREYYEKDGQEHPGKKGISLPIEQFATLVTLLPDIELALKDLGALVPRPDYANENCILAQSGDESSSSGRVESSRIPRKNIESTSEEDESEE